MIRIVVMGRCVCGLEVVGIACYSFPGVVWMWNACVGDSYWDSREMEYARSTSFTPQLLILNTKQD